MTYEVKYFKSQNTIQEDLFLLAKGHYKTQNIERLTALRLILAVHVTGMDYIRDRDLLHWLLSSFYNPGIILPRREDVHRLMVNPGGTSPTLGCCQRNNASTPRRRPSSNDTCGW